ncbi:MAG: hypothetical protein V4484_18195 [Pseudomonadota bacterium]
MRPFTYKTLTLCALASLTLAACSPKFNWRDYSSQDAPFRVMFPDKPSTHTRSVDLDGLKVDMTMTAAQVDGNMFAVGTAEAPDAAHAEAALAAMKTAMVKNIGATIDSEKSGNASAVAGASAARSAAIDIDAHGVQNGVPMRLIGHFESRNKRFYQVIVLGKQKDLSKENVEMFMSSFKLQ